MMPTLEASRAALQVGAWATTCCHLDLTEVTPANIEDFREQLEIDDEPVRPHVWPSRRDALLAIREGWTDPVVLAEIDTLLRDA